MKLTQPLEQLADKIRNDDFITLLDHTSLSFWECIQPDGIAPDPEAVRECNRLKLEMVPIIAILGGKNSGKTTLVKKFLLEENHPRLLIGDDPDLGTNRFVLWLPENWSQNQDKLEVCKQWIETAFGHAPEELPLAPEPALQRQYDMDDHGIQLDTPLLGFDKNLNELQLAVLDCPDMEVPHGQVSNSVENATEIRRKALQSASRVCSSFFVLMLGHRLGAEVFTDTFQNILNPTEDNPPIYLVVSRNDNPSFNVTEEANKQLERHELRSRVRDIIDCPYVRVREGREVIYRHADGSRFDPVKVSGNLKPSSLELERLLSGLNALETAINKTKTEIEILNKEAEARRVKIQKNLLEFIDAHFVDDDGNLRNIYTPEDSKILFDAFYTSAPRWIKINLSTVKFLKGTKNAFTKFPENIIKKLREELGIKLRKPVPPKNIAKGEDFAARMKFCSEIPTNSEARLKNVWDKAFQFLNDDKHNYLEMKPDPRELEEAFQETWDEIKTKELIKISAAMVFTFLLFVLVLVVDAVTLTGAGTWVASASLPELLAALGLGALANGATNPRVCNIYEQKVARPQLSRLYAVLLDGLHIQRAPDSLLETCRQNDRLKLTSVMKEEVGYMDPVFDQTDEEYTILENAEPLINAINVLKIKCREEVS